MDYKILLNDCGDCAPTDDKGADEVTEKEEGAAPEEAETSTEEASTEENA